MGTRVTLSRWLRFNGIGVLGVLVQLGVLATLVKAMGLHYLAATAIAVEAAVLHNFVWHQRWTWRDRPARSGREVAGRIVRFHFLNGAISLGGNLAIMAVLAGAAGLEPVAANAVAIVICSTLNFLASEALVFRTAGTATVVLALAGAPAAAAAGAADDFGLAELSPAAIAAWQRYEKEVDGRYARTTAGSTFFVQDAFGLANGWRSLIASGQVSMARVPSFAPGAAEPDVPDGRIHHWTGAVFIPRASVAQVVRYLQDRAGREADAFDDVLSSKLLSRAGDRLRVYMKLRRESVITVTYNTEHDVEYRHLSDARASSRSVASKIAELENAGTPQEREKPAGRDHGFLWRLNAYWRYEQVKDGVVIECESVSLSRSVPLLLRPFVTGTVERIARESLEKTLVSLRAELLKVAAVRQGAQ
jgi:putative flippase GtrA